MDNGDKAVIETENLSCSSWTCGGKEMMKAGDKSILQCFPAAGTPIKGHFVPEERAKKLSFDRMIYKLEPEVAKISSTVTSLFVTAPEYDVIVKNLVMPHSTAQMVCSSTPTPRLPKKRDTPRDPILKLRPVPGPLLLESSRNTFNVKLEA